VYENVQVHIWTIIKHTSFVASVFVFMSSSSSVFTARRSMCIAWYCYNKSSVRPSETSVFFTINVLNKIYVDIRGASPETRRKMIVGWLKTSIFSAFGRYVFGTLGNETNVIKSIISSLFPFHWPQTYEILNDLEWPFYAKFCFCVGIRQTFAWIFWKQLR